MGGGVAIKCLIDGKYEKEFEKTSMKILQKLVCVCVCERNCDRTEITKIDGCSLAQSFTRNAKFNLYFTVEKHYFTMLRNKKNFFISMKQMTEIVLCVTIVVPYKQ